MASWSEGYQPVRDARLSWELTNDQLTFDALTEGEHDAVAVESRPSLLRVAPSASAALTDLPVADRLPRSCATPSEDGGARGDRQIPTTTNGSSGPTIPGSAAAASQEKNR